MCDIQFKYFKNHQIPNELRLLTESLLGYSFIDDSPIYNIKFDVDNNLINSLLFKLSNKKTTIEQIQLYLRKEKTKKVLNNIKDKNIDKFSIFLQYYLDNIEHMIILKSPVSEA